NVVTGDAKQGEAYFNGGGRCNSCHSPTGDLAGIAKKYDPVALQSRFLYPRARPSGAPPAAEPLRASVTVTQAGEPPVSGKLEYMDDFYVTLRDASGDSRSYPRQAGVKVTVRDPLAAHEELLKKYSDADMHNVLAYLVTLR